MVSQIPSSVMITGANGLVGQRLGAVLEGAGWRVIRAVRQARADKEIAVGDMDGRMDWGGALATAPDTVVHLAARVHQMHEEPATAARLHRMVNTEGSLNLARQAAASGVRRLVFLSTIKVLGEGRDTPYRGDDPLDPLGPYAQSKADAERGLWAIAAETGMEVVVIRPPLVYGPGVRANFQRLMQAVAHGRPLPLGSIRNRRSLVYLDNLVDAIRVCLTHPKAAGNAYLVSDGDDVSTPELIRRIAAAFGCPPRLLPVSPALMRMAGRLLGKGAAVDRLLGSLTVDISALHDDLGWQPPYDLRAGLAATAAWFRES